MKILRNVFLVVLGILLAAICLFISYYFVVTRGVELSAEKLLVSGADIMVCDIDGEVISTANEKNGIRLDGLPDHVQYAFVDTEDKKFFFHHGFDYPRIAKACLKNISSRSFKQGASTISQQLIKNTHLNQKKTLRRKLQEWKLTRQLESRYSKQEILENYLSIIYFGHNCFGINSAAEFYFGKVPKELTVGEACILAGLVKSPNNYSPFKAPENCQNRKRVVLNNMQKNGHLTEQEKTLALDEPLPNAPTLSSNTYGYMHRVFDEFGDIIESQNLVLGGKIQLNTYCDTFVQSILETVATTDTETDKTLSVIDNHSCGYKAYVSSVDNIRRSPASLLKPLLIFAPAIEENLLSPATPILDEKVDFAGYSPQNYDNTFHGYISARESLARSLNVPAVKILNSLRIQKGVSYLEKLGLQVHAEDYSLALALGGMKNGFTAEKLFSAYTVFANGGMYQPSRFIRSVYIDGQCVYKNHPQKTRVYSEETAYLTADILKTAVDSGTAKKLRSLPCPIYAKTGTAGTENGNTDAYGVAFTSQDVLGVWLGNADHSAISHTGGGMPCNFIYRIQTRLLEHYRGVGLSLTTLKQPKGVVSAKLDKFSYDTQREVILADPLAPAKYQIQELFKRSQLPTQTSSIFSRPTVAMPKLNLTENGILITLQEQKLYRYQILRYENAQPTVLYDGEYLSQFLDETAQEDKKYQYAIIPYYGKQKGKEIRLPVVNTYNHVFTNREEKEMLNKNWWEY